MSDRTYATTGRRLNQNTVHAVSAETWFRALCPAVLRGEHREDFDRVPRDRHLCGHCARAIAAATDIEYERVMNRRELRDDDRGPFGDAGAAAPV